MTIIAKRANGQPAHMSARPRLRQSQIATPFNHAPAQRVGWIGRIIGRNVK